MQKMSRAQTQTIPQRKGDAHMVEPVILLACLSWLGFGTFGTTKVGLEVFYMAPGKKLWDRSFEFTSFSFEFLPLFRNCRDCDRKTNFRI